MECKSVLVDVQMMILPQKRTLKTLPLTRIPDFVVMILIQTTMKTQACIQMLVHVRNFVFSRGKYLLVIAVNLT